MLRAPWGRLVSCGTLALGVALPAASALAATGDRITEWLPWLVLGAIVLLVAGLLLRTVLAARFPKGYKAWANRNRESFASRNDAWDRQDDEFRK